MHVRRVSAASLCIFFPSLKEAAAARLWNADTGELICRNTALYGNGTEIENEKGYVVGIPPCVWGSEAEGLLPPPKIHLDSNLTTVKRTNNTNAHWGVMALWQSRGAYLS